MYYTRMSYIHMSTTFKELKYFNWVTDPPPSYPNKIRKRIDFSFFPGLGVESGAIAAGLCHSNARSQPHLQPTPQLTATLDP